MEREPNLITSGLSREIVIDGHTLRVEIYRIDTDPKWALEVVDESGTSTVWDDLFDTDQDAVDEAMKTIEEEGLAAFRETGKVIPFPSRD